jgi:hypothetical protein
LAEDRMVLDAQDADRLSKGHSGCSCRAILMIPDGKAKTLRIE